jgi:hypothetical protein
VYSFAGFFLSIGLHLHSTQKYDSQILESGLHSRLFGPVESFNRREIVAGFWHPSRFRNVTSEGVRSESVL